MAQILPFVRKNPAHKATEQQPQAPQPLESQASEPPPKALHSITLEDADKLLDYYLLMSDMQGRCVPGTPVETLLTVAMKTLGWVVKELTAELKIGRLE
jgi:hypothetical protein